MQPTYDQKHFDDFDFTAIKNTWFSSMTGYHWNFSLISKTTRGREGKGKAVNGRNLLSFKLPVIRRHSSPLLHPLLSIQKSIRLLYKVSTCLLSPQVIHLKLAPLEKQYYFVQRLPMHIICLNRVDLLSQCHPLMSAMKQQLSFPLHSEPLLSLDRVHPTHL